MITIVELDKNSEQQGRDFILCLDSYTRELQGGEEGLREEIKTGLIPALTERNNVHVFLAYNGDDPAGFIVCIESFSTFAALPVINIHDIGVMKKHRGAGVGRQLMARAEELAGDLGCCKLTLEVLENNTPARELYKKSGFNSYELDPTWGRALFLEKKLIT